MPAHLVPSPRRLAKLQADGQVTEHLSGMQIPTKIPENQSLAPSQNKELTQEGAAPPKGISPESQVSTEPLTEPSPSAPGLSQKAQDLSPNQKEGDAQQSALSSKTATTNLPENEARTSEVKAGEEGQPATPSQGPLQHPDPPPAQGPQLAQDEESGEARVTPSSPPCSELPQGSDPASFGPQRIQEGETGSASLTANSSHHDPPRDLSGPDEVIPGPPPGDSQEPEEGVPKAEVARVDTPYPEMPHPQDSTDTPQTQDRGDPMTLTPRSWLAPTRLPQPRVLAPFQSRRPTPKLLSPGRDEALGTASDQTVTPSPRPLLAQDEDPSKLPLISSPHSKQPPNPSPHQDPSPQQVQEEKVREVKLPLISPPVQEPSAALHPPQEVETHLIKLPRISTPFSEQLPQNMAPSDSRSAKERQTPKAGHSSSKKIPDTHASPQNHEPGQPAGARKKKLPGHRETAKGPAHLKRVPPGGHRAALQPESQRKPTSLKLPSHPNPSPPQSPQGNRRGKVQTPDIPEPPNTEPVPKDAQVQEEKRGNVLHSRKKVHANLPADDLVQKGARSKKGPALKRQDSGGLSQENTTTLSGDQATPEGQLPHRRPPQSEEVSAESASEGSAACEHPRRKKEDHRRDRSQTRETSSDPPGQDGMAPIQQPVKDTQAKQGASQTGPSSVQRDHTSRQQTKDRGTWKHRGAPGSTSLAAPQDQASAGEQGNWKGRLRARGSQSTKV